MKRTYIFAFTLVAFVYLPVSATIINVPDDYPTIQQGIDASTDGDTVLVHPGTYMENINFNLHNIVLGSLFLTTGDTSYISLTLIDGTSSGPVITFPNGWNSTGVVVGFTIENGFSTEGGGIYCGPQSYPLITNNKIINNRAYSTNGMAGYGGGIYCFDPSDPEIRDNYIADNIADKEGGGIYSESYENVLIASNIISSNSAEDGGGIYCWSASPTITGNIITGNSAEGDGGGIGCFDSNPEIDGNVISDNSAHDGGGIFSSEYSIPLISGNVIKENVAYGGGGIHCKQSNPIITNNVIYDNMGIYDGGGIYCNSASPTIINCTFSANSAGASGGGIYCRYNSFPPITNTVFWADTAQNGPEIYIVGSSPSFTFCDIQGGWEGEGNIDFDPFLRDPENDDFHMMTTACGDSYDSPCIDVGNPDIIDSLLDCSWGLATILSDIGAYGGGDSLTHGGGIIIVPDDYPTIQEAIYACPVGDTVLVRPGLYVENIRAVEYSYIKLGSFFLITGDTSFISQTIIDGDLSGPVITCARLDSSFGCFISGFTIQNGSSNMGGGINCGDYSYLTISNNIIRANSAESWGGGILCELSSGIIRDNVIVENSSARYGGGIYIAYYSNPIVQGNVIAFNSAISGGGLGCYSGSHASVLNNTIYGNSADYGGGFFCWNSNPTVINTIFWADSAQIEGDEISVYSGAPTITYCDIQGGWEGEGNIDCDPLFCNSENYNFYLAEASCCLGAGENGEDIGAFGVGCEVPTDIVAQHQSIPNQFSLSQNYPNPFNATTVIQYNLPLDSDVTINIYNILGRKVETLFDAEQPAGYHHIVWDASDRSSGMYFYRIQAAEYSETKKMVLLK